MVVGALAVATVAPLRVALLRCLGQALVAGDPVQPADAILVPEWAGEAGALETADLVAQSVAPRVAIISGPPTVEAAEYARRHAAYQSEVDRLAQNLASLGVTKVDRPIVADGTEAEGDVLALWCRQNRARTIVVVSPPDHSRRLRRVLRRSMRGQAITTIVRPARYSGFSADNWWESRDTLRTGLVELEKLLLDIARHPLS